MCGTPPIEHSWGGKTLDTIHSADAVREAMIARMYGMSDWNEMLSAVSGEMKPATKADAIKDWLAFGLMGLFVVGLFSFAISILPNTRLGQLLGLDW